MAYEIVAIYPRGDAYYWHINPDLRIDYGEAEGFTISNRHTEEIAAQLPTEDVELVTVTMPAADYERMERK